MHASNLIGQITSEAIYLTIIVSLPTIVASLVVGMAVAIFSAVTQIQEQTLSFAPKMFVVYCVLAATGGCVGHLLVQFAIRCFSDFNHLIGQ